MTGNKHYSSKLTDIEVLEIRQIWARNMTAKELAAKYGVAKITIEKIVNQMSWKHLPSVADFIKMKDEGK